MEIKDFEQRTLKASEALGLSLSSAQINTLQSYLKQLGRWNKTYNLTALRDPELMLVQHIFDSLAIVPAVQKIAQSKNAESFKIVDVGSGGGLPGVVLAIASFTWNVHCVDAVEKKMAFVRQMSAVLKLSNLHAHHARIEQIESFNADLIISRAFASLVDFVRLSEKHLSPTGQIVAMKAKLPTEEIALLESETDWRVSAIEELTVPELSAERCLVYLNRVKNDHA